MTVTDRPGRNSRASGPSRGKAIRTGTRCTILVKLPVALSGGSRLNWAPLAGAKLSTVPASGWSGIGVDRDLGALPGPHPRQLRLLEIGGDINPRQRHHRQQFGARA